jgi:hypothetical protein
VTTDGVYRCLICDSTSASRHVGQPARSGVGTAISDPNNPNSSAGVNVRVFQNPDSVFRHLEFHIERFSKVQSALGLFPRSAGFPEHMSGSFDRFDPCLSVFVNLGSGSDGSIGDDTTNELTNCVSPSPSPSPLTTRSSVSDNPASAALMVPEPAPLVAALSCDPAQKPSFQRKVSAADPYPCIDVRVCLNAGTRVGNIGIRTIVLETSLDGA